MTDALDSEPEDRQLARQLGTGMAYVTAHNVKFEDRHYSFEDWKRVYEAFLELRGVELEKE